MLHTMQRMTIDQADRVFGPPPRLTLIRYMLRHRRYNDTLTRVTTTRRWQDRIAQVWR